jgi:hypothetical protein
MFVSHATRQAALLALFSSRYCASRMAAATFLQQRLPVVFDEFLNCVLPHWYKSDLRLKINQLPDHRGIKTANSAMISAHTVVSQSATFLLLAPVCALLQQIDGNRR